MKLKTLGWALLLGLPFLGIAAEQSMGWNFDAGLPPEKARDLLLSPEMPAPPAGSWLRLRGIENSTVLDRAGAEKRLYGSMPGAPPVAERRRALAELKERGYGTVAFVRWGPDTWPGGFRKGLPLRRLPIDLREAFERCRALASTYGDLIDYWEIENEPDISFVEENPETYAAFLKACYLGIYAARGERLRRSAPDAAASRRGHAERETSRVLMAPLALPPGPYFEAFVRNHGLSYTYGFNYHYYGYAEDFTGVYRQFEDAVSAESPEGGGDQSSVVGRPMSETPSSVVSRLSSDTPSVFSTRFLPNAAGWSGTVAASFNHGAQGLEPVLKQLIDRPLASEEPLMHRQGRWLATHGVRVEETVDGWRFIVERYPAGPIRAPVVELPLPVGWNAPAGALLNYEYRLDRSRAAAKDPFDIAQGKQEHAAEDEVRKTSAERSNTVQQRTALRVYDPNSPGKGVSRKKPEVADARIRGQAEPLVVRELPVFLTEYGYGGLDKESRLTPEGRERQRRWFGSVAEQIQALGIEGAMAFYLPPYLEVDLLEFGLLMTTTSGPSEDETLRLHSTQAGQAREQQERRETRDKRQETGQAHVAKDGRQKVDDGGLTRAGAKWGEGIVSPALAELLQQGRKPLQPQRWQIATQAPTDVVIDFIAGNGLGQAKSYGGYFLDGDHGRSQPGEGMLALYNFSDEPASGALILEGDAWSLADGASNVTLALQPGERRLIAVQVFPKARRFEPSIAGARFKCGDVPPEPPPPAVRPSSSGVPPPAVPPQPKTELRPRDQIPEIETFEGYFRTANGNLYQTWPRLQATALWQRYMEHMGNFTPAFYGRHTLPWRFTENEPVSLVFFFHPKKLPVVYEVRHPQVVTFEQP